MTTPNAMDFHSATSSLRARATMVVFLPRPSAILLLNQSDSADCGWFCSQKPSKFDQRRSEARVSGFGDPLFVADRAALPRRRRQPGVGGDLTPVVEVAVQPLRPEDVGELGAYALETKQQVAGRGDRVRPRFGEKFVALRLHRFDLVDEQFQPVEFPRDR